MKDRRKSHMWYAIMLIVLLKTDEQHLKYAVEQLSSSITQHIIDGVS